MFSKNKKEKEAPPQGKKNSLSMIGTGCRFEGLMLLQGETRLSGHTKGKICSSHTLIVEQTAVIDGDIQGNHVEVHGCIRGNIRCDDTLIISPHGKVEGDICTVHLVVQDGAKLSGKVQVQASC